MVHFQHDLRGKVRHASPVGVAEDLVAACYQRIGISEDTYNALASQVDAAFEERLASRSQELAELTANRKRLHDESDKLLAAHFADAIDLETLKRHQDRIRTGLAKIDRKLDSEHEEHTGHRKHLTTAMGPAHPLRADVPAVRRQRQASR